MFEFGLGFIIGFCTLIAILMIVILHEPNVHPESEAPNVEKS